MNSVRSVHIRHWCAGLALAGAGVALARLAAPGLDARPSAAVALAGELAALAGLLVIARGIRLRPRPVAPETT